MMSTLFNSNAACYHLYLIVGSLQGKPQIVLRFTFIKKKKKIVLRLAQVLNKRLQPGVHVMCMKSIREKS